MRGSAAEVLSHPSVDRLLRVALDEDLGGGDVTTSALAGGDERRARGLIVAKAATLVAGVPLVGMLFDIMGGGQVVPRVTEGERVAAEGEVVEITAPAARILAVERTSLNVLQHLSGVATLTRRYVDAVEGTRCRIVDTRKTLPGLRLLEKYAVRVGGGASHRFGLGDGVLIKENHAVLCGGVAAAVARARAAAPHPYRVEVECRSTAEVEAAVAAGADIVLLDNMGDEEITAAIRLVGGRALVEASGNITPERAATVARAGVHFISVGALTHSAPAADLSLQLVLC